MSAPSKPATVEATRTVPTRDTEADKAAATAPTPTDDVVADDPATRESADDPGSSEQGRDGDHESATTRRRRFGRMFSRRAVLAYRVLPTVALLLALGAAFFKWQDASVGAAQAAAIEATQAARDSTIALLSYNANTVDKDLVAARDRLSGAFRDSYTALTNDVVIPGAKQKHISAVATVPAAAVVSATRAHAVILVFVNQTTIIGNDPPSDTASSVKVTLDNIRGRWLITDFQPV